ncbi:MAG: DUF6491 family protein [Cellvibrionaceae bacterium]
MKKQFALTFLFLFLIFSLGCTTTQPTEDKLATTLEKMELTTGEPKDRILNYNVRSWKYVDSRHIILEARRKEFYLINFRTPCTGLSGALDIGFTSFGSSLSKFEKIIVREPHGMDQDCSIKDIIELVPAETNSNKEKTSENTDEKAKE